MSRRETDLPSLWWPNVPPDATKRVCDGLEKSDIPASDHEPPVIGFHGDADALATPEQQFYKRYERLWQDKSNGMYALQVIRKALRDTREVGFSDSMGPSATVEMPLWAADYLAATTDRLIALVQNGDASASDVAQALGMVRPKTKNAIKRVWDDAQDMAAAFARRRKVPLDQIQIGAGSDERHKLRRIAKGRRKAGTL
jgi:hypothetical protein